MIRTALLLACLALAGCAGLSRTASYGMELADAQPVIDGRAYRIYVHPHDDTLLLERPILTSMGQGAIRGATLHLAQPGEAYDPWKQAVATFLQPVGCAATDVYSLGGDGGAWEARFHCPEGVDLRRLVLEQRAALRGGQPLHR